MADLAAHIGLDLIAIGLRLELTEQPLAAVHPEPAALDVLLIHGLILMAIAACLGDVVSRAVITDIDDVIGIAIEEPVPGAGVSLTELNIFDSLPHDDLPARKFRVFSECLGEVAAFADGCADQHHLGFGHLPALPTADASP